jgi:hypothetical protein
MNVEKQLRMGMKVLPPSLDVVVHGGNAVDDRHGSPRSAIVLPT